MINGRDPSRVAAAVEELREELPGANVDRRRCRRLDGGGGPRRCSRRCPRSTSSSTTSDLRARAVLEVADEPWQCYWDVNVMSGGPPDPPLHARHARRGWGRVQFMASDSAVVIPKEMVHYGVTKTALLGVSRGYAKALAGRGVTVNAVIAGPTHTEGVEDFVRELVGDELPWDEAQAEFVRLHRPQSLLGRLIEPDEIANLVAYLSSEQASATTGRRAARRRRVRGTTSCPEAGNWSNRRAGRGVSLPDTSHVPGVTPPCRSPSSSSPRSPSPRPPPSSPPVPLAAGAAPAPDRAAAVPAPGTQVGSEGIRAQPRADGISLRHPIGSMQRRDGAVRRPRRAGATRSRPWRRRRTAHRGEARVVRADSRAGVSRFVLRERSQRGLRAMIGTVTAFRRDSASLQRSVLRNARMRCVSQDVAWG